MLNETLDKSYRNDDTFTQQNDGTPNTENGTVATITFRQKPEAIVNMDGTHAYDRVRIPVKIERRHCDMHAFRMHPKIGPYANSDFFPSVLARSLKEIGLEAGGYIRLDRVPAGVSVDTSGFLAKVTIEIP